MNDFHVIWKGICRSFSD